MRPQMEDGAGQGLITDFLAVSGNILGSTLINALAPILWPALRESGKM
jgi:hypothetical protein